MWFKGRFRASKVQNVVRPPTMVARHFLGKSLNIFTNRLQTVNSNPEEEEIGIRKENPLLNGWERFTVKERRKGSHHQLIDLFSLKKGIFLSILPFSWGCQIFSFRLLKASKNCFCYMFHIWKGKRKPNGKYKRNHSNVLKGHAKVGFSAISLCDIYQNFLINIALRYRTKLVR